MINNIIINPSLSSKKNTYTKKIIVENNIYEHDIGKWALVKFCNYPQSILYPNVDKIPSHVIRSLK